MLHSKLISAILLLFLFVYTPLVQAETYFEYAPDAWQSYRHTVSTDDTPYQFFQSATDFTLTSFSFWVDNTGSSGAVTFTLLDDENTTLAQKTVTLNQTPAVPGGTRLDIALSTPVEISHYRTYSIQISSTLIGFGLYYANRITILEHNLAYTTEYAMGVAQLGSEQQSYTFKFALGEPSADSDEDENPSEEPPLEEPAATSSTPIATVISNARITSITDTSALAAWTTNVAADSRISIRSQLNPLYVYTTAYDDTIELEHALSITGLVPDSGYFVDFFSQQNPNEPILTTYTVSFTTAKASTSTPPASSSSTPPAPDATPAASSSTPTASTTTDLPLVTFGAGNGTDSFSVNWNTPADGAPSDGYRIDILDENHQLVRQLTAPTDATSRNIALLHAGEHEIIVYANNEGVYKKVASSTLFEAKKSRSPLFWFWYLIGVTLSLLVAFAFLFHRKEKTKLTPLE